MRTLIGFSCGHTARIALKTSKRIAASILERTTVFVRAQIRERRNEARQQVTVSAVKFEPVESRRQSPRSVAETKSALMRSISARVASRGV